MDSHRWETGIAALALLGLALHGLLRWAGAPRPAAEIPLQAVLVAGGLPLLAGVARGLLRRELGTDVLAAASILASAALGQALVGSIIVLMLAGGGALERLAARRASSALDALARRLPRLAHRREGGALVDVPLGDIAAGDALVVLPHELCPADGVVVEGRSRMDESYLTGEPYELSKAPGSRVLSGAVNGEGALEIRAAGKAADSRYARILRVMEEAQRCRPRLRRLADQLAAWYAPLAFAAAGGVWLATGDPMRFLAVLVIATPCPLIIAIPVCVLGAVSLAARRSILVKDPAALEQITLCRTVILDKTGTLTCGKPVLTEVLPAGGFDPGRALALAASLEQYSRHPLAAAVLAAARGAGLPLSPAAEVREKPGMGLGGVVDAVELLIAGRSAAPPGADLPPPPAAGLECVLLVGGALAAAFRFRDAPRPESRSFVGHLEPLHGVGRLMLVSGDREAEVRALAEQVGIAEAYAQQSPEEKLELVTREAARAKTLFIGDGINDAPALAAATVGVAIGLDSDVTSEAAAAVIMTPSIAKVDELLHIGRRMRAIALESAIGGMSLSLAGMALAALGGLPPVEGAVAQELIDLAAVLNALRAAVAPRSLTDVPV